jgi:predicted nicotinamide N-methyase
VIAADKLSFIRAHTTRCAAPLVPEINLHLATEITPIWQATEDWLREHALAPPYWAFAWPGGQALARHVLDNRSLFAGKRVLDFGAGGGLAAIACARAGAAAVEAADIDDFARTAIRLNACINNVAVSVPDADIVGAACRWDIILCGDICYELPMTSHVLPWLRRMARAALVWIADPGRAYVPLEGMTAVRQYSVPTTLELEDRVARDVVIYRLGP